MGKWNGKTKAGNNLEVGTYAFIATYITPYDDKEQIIKGNIILIK